MIIYKSMKYKSTVSLSADKKHCNKKTLKRKKTQNQKKIPEFLNQLTIFEWF